MLKNNNNGTLYIVIHFRHFLLTKYTSHHCHTTYVHEMNLCHLINSHREDDFCTMKGIMSYMRKDTPQ